MKRIAGLPLILLTALLAIGVYAQEKDDKNKKPPKPKPVPVYLGNSSIDSGLVSKRTFDSLIRQGLTAKDSAGHPYNVNSFFMTFCERAVYEDSVGNLMLMTDYLSEYCFDSKLKEYQLNVLLERTKKGDTVIFEDIKLTSADSNKGAHGKPMRLIISK